MHIIYDRSVQSLSRTHLHIIYDVFAHYLRHIIYNTVTQRDSTDHHQNPSPHRALPKRVGLLRASGCGIGFCSEATEQGLPVTSAFRALICLQYVGLVVETGVALGFTQSVTDCSEQTGEISASVQK